MKRITHEDTTMRYKTNIYPPGLPPSYIWPRKYLSGGFRRVQCLLLFLLHTRFTDVTISFGI